MQGYPQINLKDLIETLGRKQIEERLKLFSCPLNADVEDFIQNKAVNFALQDLASVWIVTASYKENWVPVGYFALANKHFHIKPDKLSNRYRREINKFGTLDSRINKYIVSAPLIGQLGKNYRNGYDKLITGDELLGMACDNVRAAQKLIGGRLVYLECEDIPSLVKFYERNGFFQFDKRELDRDEKDKQKGDYLIQMFKSLHI